MKKVPQKAVRPRIRRASAALAVLVLVVGALSACEPPPPSPGDGTDLGLITTGVPTTLQAGRANDYSVQVANYGTATATDARFLIVAPRSFDVDGTIAGTDCTDHGNDGDSTSYLMCDLGDLAPSATVTIDVEASVGDWSAPHDVDYAVSSDGSDPVPDPHPNLVKIPTTTNRPTSGVPSVAITTPGESATVAANATIDYAGTATDDTDGDLSNQITWAYLPAGVPDATPTSLGTGASGSFGPLAQGIYVLTASVTDSADETATATRVISVGPAVVNPHDLGIDTSGVADALIVGSTSAGTLTVHNYGTEAATGAQLVLTAPTAIALTATAGETACARTTAAAT